MDRSPSPFSADDTATGRLLVETAKAANHEQLGRVIDESLERSAQLRREQEARDEVRRREERRRERIEESERVEQHAAERASQRRQEERERQEAIDAQRRAIYLDRLTNDPAVGSLDLDAPLDLHA